ncbi:hypothetical protein DCS_00274 [Drechmeria coniospora]|uniref:Uncharacterized protein n=1 Tax=Drechmeria coniospora TaxID=98403 RepID=A0A151GPV1_DRECN|nr:hypothetical protein DCS_00274 [Drechmeria coniospora]KYK59144.1 hypothetical protein DCS_00274 [Drechmeria coniospora]ODA77895.1 hypothetical protein RJ55_06498 [Drechmeria coniospora]
MPSQRPYFLSSFLSSFRQQGPSIQTTQQPNKHSTQAPSASTAAAAAAAASATYTHHPSGAAPRSLSTNNSASASVSASASASVQNINRSSPMHASRAATTTPTTAVGNIPIPNASGRRRGSDSSSEGFREAFGADKWYIGGRTAAGDETFFKLGVVRRVRSNDGLSLDRLSL